MALVRTNVTLSPKLLAMIDEVAGPRGRSRYIADVLERQVRRDAARATFASAAGSLASSTTWGRDPGSVSSTLRTIRREWDGSADDAG